MLLDPTSVDTTTEIVEEIPAKINYGNIGTVSVKRD